ncbi:MAG: peptidase glycoprotease [Bacteroidetes bacterium]|nr:peptidase glycoprotease [Bacteroidota bacterium]
MAVILHLETATTVCSVALAADGKLLALKEQNGEYSHAENLTVFIEEVLQQANVALTSVDAIAISKGPGSYTGLRIGVSTAKGLCYSLNKPLIAIDTLQYLALGVSQTQSPISNIKHPALASQNPKSLIPNPKSLFCPMIDARRMEVYCAVYDATGKEIKSTAAEIIDEHSFSGLLQDHTVYFFGDGAAKCKDVLSQHKNAVFLDNVVISAKDMITLAAKAFDEKHFEDVAYFEPFYLKDFVAGKKKEK